MNYAIKLLRYSPTSEPEDNILINHNYRMLIKVQQAIGLPPEIFLFQKNSKTTYEFISVCLPIDLLKYPAVDPATEDFTKLETRFFRHWQTDITPNSTPILIPVLDVLLAAIFLSLTASSSSQTS